MFSRLLALTLILMVASITVAQVLGLNPGFKDKVKAKLNSKSITKRVELSRLKELLEEAKAKARRLMEEVKAKRSIIEAKLKEVRRLFSRLRSILEEGGVRGVLRVNEPSGEVKVKNVVLFDGYVHGKLTFNLEVKWRCLKEYQAQLIYIELPS